MFSFMSLRAEDVKVWRFENFPRTFKCLIRYDTIQTFEGKKLTGSQLSLPHGINKRKCDRSSSVPLSWGSPVGKRNLRWEGFVEKVGFEPGVKERRSDGVWDRCISGDFSSEGCQCEIRRARPNPSKKDDAPSPHPPPLTRLPAHPSPHITPQASEA